MQVDLSIEQVELLQELLSEKKRSLLLEIAHTTHREFRHELQHQATVLDNLLENVTKANVLQKCS